MPRSPQPGPNASVRAAGLVLTLFATAAGAAGAAQLTPARQWHRPNVVPPAPPTELDTHLDAHARERLDARTLEPRVGVAPGSRALRVAGVRAGGSRTRRRNALRNASQCGTSSRTAKPAGTGTTAASTAVVSASTSARGACTAATSLRRNPQWATKAQQIEVAERIAQDGYGGWGCARRLGWVD